MSSDEKKKIEAILVLEVIGRPPEYLTETLNGIIKSMGEEKGVKVKKIDMKEPVEMQNQKGFYTTFAEIEVEADEIMYIAVLLFKYMPAHIEILSPQNFSMPNSEWSGIFNEITRRLHGYEEMARMIQAEKMILENQLKTILDKEGKAEAKDSPEKKEETDKKKKKAKKKKDDA